MQLAVDIAPDSRRRSQTKSARNKRVAHALRIRISALVDEAVELVADIEWLDQLIDAKLEALIYANRTAREMSDAAARLERRPTWRAAA